MSLSKFKNEHGLEIEMGTDNKYTAKTRVFLTSELKKVLGEKQELFSAKDEFYDDKFFINLCSTPCMKIYRKRNFLGETEKLDTVFQITQDYLNESYHVVRFRTPIEKEEILQNYDVFLDIQFKRFSFVNYPCVVLDVVVKPFPYEVLTISAEINSINEAEAVEKLLVSIQTITSQFNKQHQPHVQLFPTYSKLFYSLRVSRYEYIFHRLKAEPVQRNIKQVISNLRSHNIVSCNDGGESIGSRDLIASGREYYLCLKIVPGWIGMTLSGVSENEWIAGKDGMTDALTELYADIELQYNEALQDPTMFCNMITDDEDY